MSLRLLAGVIFLDLSGLGGRSLAENASGLALKLASITKLEEFIINVLKLIAIKSLTDITSPRINLIDIKVIEALK